MAFQSESPYLVENQAVVEAHGWMGQAQAQPISTPRQAQPGSGSPQQPNGR